MRLLDSFTTRDGSWQPNGQLYSITAEAVSKYDDCPFKGAATHIIVKAPSGTRITCQTSDQKNATNFVVGEPNWINFPLFHSSAYNPDRGERGPWEVWANGALIVDGIGLPYGWHVSTFLIMDEATTGTMPVPPPPKGDMPKTAREAIEKAQAYLDLAKGLL